MHVQRNTRAPSKWTRCKVIEPLPPILPSPPANAKLVI